MSANQTQWGALVEDLRRELIATYESSGLDSESITRLDFELESTFSELRSLDLGGLSESEHGSLLSSVRDEFGKHLQQFRSQIADLKAADERECEKIRADIARVTAERETLAAERAEMELQLAPIRALQRQISSARREEKLLLGWCAIKGISPNQVLPNEAGEC